MKSIRAWWIGVRDGFAQPRDLTFGMSWDDAALSEAYDRGANIGQRIGRLLHHD